MKINKKLPVLILLLFFYGCSNNSSEPHNVFLLYDHFINIERSKKLNSEPATMLAADDKLFVVATDGTIQCFGKATAEPVVHEHQIGTITKNGDAAKLVIRALEGTPRQHAYALVLGVANG